MEEMETEKGSRGVCISCSRIPENLTPMEEIEIKKRPGPGYHEVLRKSCSPKKMPFFLFFFLSFFLFFFPSFFLSVFLSVFLFVFLSVFLSVFIFVLLLV